MSSLLSFSVSSATATSSTIQNSMSSSSSSFSPPPSATAEVTKSTSSDSTSAAAPSSSSSLLSSWRPSIPTFGSENSKESESSPSQTSSEQAPLHSYESRDFSQWKSQIYDSDGLNDSKLEKEAYYARMNPGSYLNMLPPRARNCLYSIQSGCFMGGCVGAIFGFLIGGVSAVRDRNLLILPVATIGGGISFGFFLGCGMILRCEEKGERYRMLENGMKDNSGPYNCFRGGVLAEYGRRRRAKNLNLNQISKA